MWSENKKRETLAWRSRNMEEVNTQKYPSNISVNFGWCTREGWSLKSVSLDMIEHFEAFKKHERLQCVRKEEKWASWRQRLENKFKKRQIIASDVKKWNWSFSTLRIYFCYAHHTITLLVPCWSEKRSMKNLSILIFLFSLARCYLFLNIYRKARCDMRSPLTTAFFFFALFLLSLFTVSNVQRTFVEEEKRLKIWGLFSHFLSIRMTHKSCDTHESKWGLNYFY